MISADDLNVFVSSLLAVVAVMFVVIWGITDHCGTECQRCRPQSKRKH